MKSILIAVSFIFALQSAISQNVTYKSKSIMKVDRSYETFEESHDIIFNDGEITITNFVGGTQPLELRVISIEKNEYQNKLYRWHRCVTKKADIISGESAHFVILEPTTARKESIKVFQVADELNIYEYSFYIRD